LIVLHRAPSFDDKKSAKAAFREVVEKKMITKNEFIPIRKKPLIFGLMAN
jgi:hypothetical protein